MSTLERAARIANFIKDAYRATRPTTTEHPDLRCQNQPQGAMCYHLELAFNYCRLGLQGDDIGKATCHL